ncbi:beta-1,3-glucanase domain-containing protein [Hirsutella rhossiliensis]|uniref:Beta-1,3-glucanase domain-containing protein n=1 Tax=Hirsutella rhossiliensis TaxID=111463 RepID=A0A9P8SDR0_9HYPO|nr:beta-1,3-glucanase domain-containing protein [Hirsutella rhossiliensis]KAH0959013.1 beta-1,3-glucanase domain-containing protein [Hirsutella rhossiliensis]
MLHPGLFDGFYQPYVDAVWAKYSKEDLTVDTQSIWGQVKGRVEAGEKLTFGAVSFGTSDVFSCSTGPFVGGPGVTGEQLNIGARLAAALNRSTLLDNAQQPEGEKVKLYYGHAVTNHYARACHETSVGGRGYAFPYDDVGASRDQPDQSGFVNAPNPRELTIGVGKPLDG